MPRYPCWDCTVFSLDSAQELDATAVQASVNITTPYGTVQRQLSDPWDLAVYRKSTLPATNRSGAEGPAGAGRSAQCSEVCIVKSMAIHYHHHHELMDITISYFELRLQAEKCQQISKTNFWLLRLYRKTEDLSTNPLQRGNLLTYHHRIEVH